MDYANVSERKLTYNITKFTSKGFSSYYNQLLFGHSHSVNYMFIYFTQHFHVLLGWYINSVVHCVLKFVIILINLVKVDVLKVVFVLWEKCC